MSRALSPSFARCYGLARVARVWKYLARQRLSLSQRDAAELRSPVALVRSAHVRTRNWQIISAGK